MRLDHTNFPESKSALIKHLLSNKKELIKQKKSLPVFSQAFVAQSSSVTKTNKPQVKAEGEPTDPNSMRVKVVANTAMWQDVYNDVMGKGSWTKSIQENGPQGRNTIVHIHDHKHEVGARIGSVKAIYSENINLRELGYDTEISEAEALVFETDVQKSYNSKVFNLYKNGDINQHSIGFYYVKLDLAVNPAEMEEAEKQEFPEEVALWEKYYSGIINKQEADRAGYFWYVGEIKLLENSAVLFGANEVTPTLSGKEPLCTPNEPTEVTQLNYDILIKNLNIK